MAVVTATGAPRAAMADPAFSTILQLPGGAGGYQPEAGVIAGPKGTLFGTADRGGTNDGGVVFQLIPPAATGAAWTERLIFRFARSAQGGYPLGLTPAADGTLFGVTLDGGSAPGVYPTGSGTVFRLAPPTAAVHRWTFSKLYVFRGGDDGASPSGGLVQDAAGGLTGTTLQGGAGAGLDGNGIVFRLAPPIRGSFDWTETVLQRFSGAPDGAIPQSPLLAQGDALRVGVTVSGGTGLCSNTGCGTVFQLRAVPGGWTEIPIYNFAGGPDGSAPVDRLVADARGSLYGATSQGGVPGASGHFENGTVYRLDPPSAAGGAWTKTTLYEFAGDLDGFLPQGGVVLDSTGAVYGTTYLGGVVGTGTLFKLTPAGAGQYWTKTILHSFGGGNGDGSYPVSGLTWDAAGALYGTTLQGGAGYGTVFRYGP